MTVDADKTQGTVRAVLGAVRSRGRGQMMMDKAVQGTVRDVQRVVRSRGRGQMMMDKASQTR